VFVSPAVAGDLVYVGSCSGTYFALNRSTGARRWTYDTRQDGDAAQFHGNPLITDDLVVTGSDGQGAASSMPSTGRRASCAGRRR